MGTDNNSEKGEEWRQQSFAVLAFPKHLHLNLSQLNSPQMLYISYPGRVHAQRWWTQAKPCTVSEKGGRGMLCIAVGVWDPRDVTEKPQIQFYNWKRLLEGVLRGINGSMPLSELVIDRERERCLIQTLQRTWSLCAGTFFANLIWITAFIFQECYQAALIQNDGEEKVTLGGHN